MTDIYGRNGLFTAGLERELGLYREIEAIAGQERAVLQEPDPASRLLPLLERKNALLGEIAEIENLIVAFKPGWRDNSALEESDRARLAGLVREIGAVLQSLISGEISAEEKLNEKYPDRSGQAPASHRGLGAVAMAAYNGYSRK